MAERKKMSVAEILAACRRMDGEGGGGAAASEPAPETEAAAEAPAAEEAAVEEAAAAEEAAPAEEPVAEAAEEEPAAEEAPAAKKPAAAKPGGARLSVAEMLAAARAEKSGAKPAAKPASAAKPAAKPAAAKPAAAAAKPAAAKPAAKAPLPDKTKPAAAKTPAKPAASARDTASILASARATSKPGPISKEEAAKQAAGKEIKVAQSKLTVPPMPVKPAYATPKPAPAKGDEDERRGFMQLLFGSSLALGFTALASTAGLWTLATARFMFPNILTEPPSRFKVGFPSEFPAGTVDERFKATNGVWIVNTDYNGVREIFALRTVCTHLGCTPNWLEGEQKFKCPCHGSGFYKDGINFEGPAPRPLERYAIRLADDGQLEVDKSKLFQEELGQWSDPSCFVSV